MTELESGTRKDWGRNALPATLYLGVIALSGAIGFLVAGGGSDPQERSFTIIARQYAYDPPVIRVNRGDTLRLRFASLDVVHGFYLEGHDLDVSITPMRTAVEKRKPSDPDFLEQVEEVVLKADRTGKFRYRCSRTCGFMHPFMLGEMIVSPNRLLPTSLGLAGGVLFGGLLFTFFREKRA
jgi:plastocyanin